MTAGADGRARGARPAGHRGPHRGAAGRKLARRADGARAGRGAGAAASSTSTAPGSSGCWRSCTSRPAGRRGARRAGRRRPGRQPAAGARPAPVRRRDQGGAGAGRRAAVPGLARRRTSSWSASATRASCRLRLLGSCDGCPSSAVTLTLAVETAIRDARPRSPRSRSRRPRASRPGPSVIPVSALAVPARTPERPRWAGSPSPAWPGWRPARWRAFVVAGTPIVGARVGADLSPSATTAPAAAAASPTPSSSAGSAAAPVTWRCAARPAGRTTTSGGPAPGSTTPTRTSIRCRCWCRTGSPRWPCRAYRSGGERHDPRARCRCCRRISARRPKAAVGERCEMCAEPIGDEHQHVVDVTSRAPAVHLPAVLPAVHRPSRRDLRYRAVPDRYLLLPRLPLLGRAVGRPGDPGRAGVLLPQLASWTAPSRSTPARPVRPSPSCRSAPGTGMRGRQPAAEHAAPDVEAVLVRAPRRASAASSAATWCRSTAATSWSAALRHAWRGFDGGQEARALLDEFFAERCGARPGGRLMPELDLHGPRRRARSRYAATPNLLARLRIEETTGEVVHAVALRARCGSSRSAAATTTPRSRRCCDLFGGRGRFADTLRPFLWMHTSTVPRASPARRRSTLPLPCSYDFEVPADVPARAAATARSRWCSCSAARCSPAGPPASRSSRSRGTARRRYRLPVAVWRALMDRALPGHRVDPGPAGTPSTRWRATSRRAGCTSWDDVVSALLAEAAALDGEAGP